MTKKLDNKKWLKVCKIPKRTMPVGNPVGGLHDFLKEKCPDLKDISSFGVSKKTNDYFEMKIEKLIRKDSGNFYTKKWYSYQVGICMLNYSPCDVQGAEDFVLYRRLPDSEEE